MAKGRARHSSGFSLFHLRGKAEDRCFYLRDFVEAVQRAVAEASEAAAGGEQLAGRWFTTEPSGGNLVPRTVGGNLVPRTVDISVPGENGGGSRTVSVPVAAFFPLRTAVIESVTVSADLNLYMEDGSVLASFPDGKKTGCACGRVEITVKPGSLPEVSGEIAECGDSFRAPSGGQTGR